MPQTQVVQSWLDKALKDGPGHHILLSQARLGLFDLSALIFRDRKIRLYVPLFHPQIRYYSS